jgi:hypothetical protein
MIRNIVDFIFDVREIMVGVNYYKDRIELQFLVVKEKITKI